MKKSIDICSARFFSFRIWDESRGSEMSWIVDEAVEVVAVVAGY